MNQLFGSDVDTKTGDWSKFIDTAWSVLKAPITTADDTPVLTVSQLVPLLTNNWLAVLSNNKLPFLVEAVGNEAVGTNGKPRPFVVLLISSVVVALGAAVVLNVPPSPTTKSEWIRTRFWYIVTKLPLPPLWISFDLKWKNGLSILYAVPFESQLQTADGTDVDVVSLFLYL